MNRICQIQPLLFWVSFINPCHEARCLPVDGTSDGTKIKKEGGKKKRKENAQSAPDHVFILSIHLLEQLAAEPRAKFHQKFNPEAKKMQRIP